MPYQYLLQIIPGTNDFVKQELLAKFPDTNINSNNISTIGFTSSIDDIFSYNILKSPLAITNQKKYRLDLKSQTWRKFSLPASTNPPLAYILCQIANLSADDILYDPFCGVGTIPITALLQFGIKQAFASDLSGKAIDFCQQNQTIAKISAKKMITFRSNISMCKLTPQSISKIISNLPFGIRTGNHEKNQKLYRILAKKCLILLKPNGTATFLTQEKKLFTETFSCFFHLKNITTIDLGGLSPNIYQLIRK